MSRLIDADDLLERMKFFKDSGGYVNWELLAFEMVDASPTVDAERHGHWIGIDDEPCEVFECDKCGYITEDIGCADQKPNNFNYCPNCGARMDETGEEK